jgi:hypothetical protein
MFKMWVLFGGILVKLEHVESNGRTGGCKINLGADWKSHAKFLF